MIKRNVSKECKDSLFHKKLLNSSKNKRHESTIWQRRFWEHTISDENDYKKHLDYIYWNPVKHGYTGSVKEWSFSTFHRDVKKGLYDADWGSDFKDNDDSNFGE